MAEGRMGLQKRESVIHFFLDYSLDIGFFISSTYCPAPGDLYLPNDLVRDCKESTFVPLVPLCPIRCHSCLWLQLHVSMLCIWPLSIIAWGDYPTWGVTGWLHIYCYYLTHWLWPFWFITLFSTSAFSVYYLISIWIKQMISYTEQTRSLCLLSSPWRGLTAFSSPHPLNKAG